MWAFFQERAEWRVNLEGHRKQKWLQLPAFLPLGLPAGTPLSRAFGVGLLVLVKTVCGVVTVLILLLTGIPGTGLV